MKKTYKIDVDCANCANKMEEVVRTSTLLCRTSSRTARLSRTIARSSCKEKHEPLEEGSAAASFMDKVAYLKAACKAKGSMLKRCKVKNCKAKSCKVKNCKVKRCNVKGCKVKRCKVKRFKIRHSKIIKYNKGLQNKGTKS